MKRYKQHRKNDLFALNDGTDRHYFFLFFKTFLRLQETFVFLVSISVLVLFVSKFLPHEWTFAHGEPEFTIHVALDWSVKVLEEALGALCSHFFQMG